MGKILGAYLLPHPPIIIPEIGKGEESHTANTIRAIKQVAEDIRHKEPDTIIIITPHGPLFQDAFTISYEDKLYGDFKKFGASNLQHIFKNNKDLVNNIIKKATEQDIMCAPIDEEFAKRYDVELELDHGSLVPLHFIFDEYKDFKLVQITYGLLTPIELYKFGMAVNKAIGETTSEVVLIASGDLSHRLTKEAPAGFNARGKTFDEQLVYLLDTGDFKNIISFDKELAEAAGECGLRSIQVMCGFLDGYKTVSEVLSYEGPFGVGYCVAGIDIENKAKRYELLHELLKYEKDKISSIRDNEDDFVRLARSSLEYYIKNEKILRIPDDLNKELLNHKAGVFVSIKKNGDLRGCIGTIEPTKDNIAKEIIANSIKAGVQDPRFYPVEKNELETLVYTVDILKEPEEIDTIDELNIYKYGVIVRMGERSGLLLPNIEGVNMPEEQVKIALQKAGISPTEPYIMERFEVERHH